MSNILVTLLGWSFFCCVGLAVTYCFFEQENIALRVSTSYFVGISLALGILRMIDFITKNFLLALVTSIALCVLLLAWKRPLVAGFAKAHGRKMLRLLPGLLLLFFAVFLYVTIGDTYGPPQSYYVLAHLGSSHSGRYVNLAYDIVVNNRIPIVGQNYFQSVVVAAFLRMGLARPYFEMNLWIDVTTANLILLGYGLLRHFGVSAGFAKIASCVVAGANTALSLCYVMVMDTGFPFLRSGYVDSNLGIGLCVIYFLYMERFLTEKGKKVSLEDGLFLLSIGMAWNMTGAHIGCIAGFISVFILIYNFIVKRNTALNAFIIGFAAFFLIGTFTGGVLTSKALYTPLTFEGMMEAQTTGTGLKILPYFEYQLGLNGIAWADQSFINSYENVLLAPPADGFTWWYNIEMAFFDVFRLVFWPLAGALGCIGLTLKGKWRKEIKVSAYMATISAALFVVGVGIAYGLLFGAKWWMSRFAGISYYAGFLCLMVVLYNFYLGKPKRRRWLVALVFVIMLCGPTVNIILQTRNIVLWDGGFVNCLKEVSKMYDLPANAFY